MTSSHSSTVHTYSVEMVRAIAAEVQKSFWIGAASFEERCCGGLALLAHANARLSKGVILDYQTSLGADPEGDRSRRDNLVRLRGDAQSVFATPLDIHAVDAYSYEDFAAFLRGLMATTQADLTVIDITCLTKIHTLALATQLADLPADKKWILCYTLPENYGEMRPEVVAGWRDVIIAPLAQSARLRNEEYSRGIVLLGHEADRLVFALSELEPSGGIIVHVDTPRRPDWMARSASVNRRSIRRLTGMRFADWHTVTVDAADYDRVASLVTAEITSAKAHDAPVILYPFGPKPFITNSARRLVAEYGEASWFVYPVPQQYDAAYTEGIAGTNWFGNC